MLVSDAETLRLPIGVRGRRMYMYSERCHGSPLRPTFSRQSTGRSTLPSIPSDLSFPFGQITRVYIHVHYILILSDFLQVTK
jgi:hypothetical protein